MKNRINLKKPIIRSRTELETYLGDIATITLARNQHQTELDQSITEIRTRYEESLGQLSKTLEEKTEIVRAWAESNPHEFNGLKSLDLVHAVIGWRTGNPTLKPLTGWNWDRVLEKLKALGSFVYLRTKEEVNKQQMLADREMLPPEKLREFGVRVVQDEAFFVEPKLTELENRQTVEA